MRINKTNDPLIFVGKEFLKKRIQGVRSLVKVSYDYPLSLFAGHIEEVIQQALSRLEDADATEDPTLQKQFYIFAWFYLMQLNRQAEIFRLVERSVEEHRWKLLKFVTLDAVKRFNLGSMPLPFFGGSFYCTGSFLYKKYGLRLSPFYQVSVDINDPILFWPLVAHEIGHCKLSEVDLTADLKKKLMKKGFREERYTERLNESLCDVLATRIYGPAYVASFLTKFWQFSGFPPSESYPRFHFRLLLMLETLESFDLEYTIHAINQLISVDRRDAEREEISFLKDDLIDVVAETPLTATDVKDKEIIKLANVPEKAPTGKTDHLYNATWFAFLHGMKSLGKSSQAIHDTLERWAHGSDSSAQL